MDIKGLDYNTQRQRLLMPEYGREIQRMVEVAIALPTKQERTRCARNIVRQMESKNPMVRDSNNYKQTLWDHLYIMSHKELDIDWPYDVSEAEKIHTKPEPMAHPVNDGSNAHLRHYGRLIGELFERLKTMPEGPARDALARETANQMKRDLTAWGHGSADDERVVSDLARFTDGKIQLDLSSFRFSRAHAGLPNEHKRNKRRK